MLFTTFLGCGDGNWDITLYEQKIEGTPKAIYKYDAWGGRDSHVFGYAILDTAKTFTISGISKLPIDKLNGIPNSKVINAIERNWPEEEAKLSFEPMDSYEIKNNGMTISIIKYQRNGLEAKRGGGWYDYSTFKETRDSLEFYDLYDSKTIQHSRIDTLKVRKGNVIIRQDENKEIIEIIIENIELSKDGTNQLLANRTYFLKPKITTSSEQFSDYGIFKEKSKVPNTSYE
ncbi:MAG: hypothetical protein ACJA2S_005697 [Cyclobacteriaceae bacterium]